MNRFLTIRTAADEIAAQLHPNVVKQRPQTAANYYSKLSDALRSFELAGHDPENYTLITRRDLAGAIALGGALISETALNKWLVCEDLDIEVYNAGQLPSGDEGDRMLLAEKERLAPGGRSTQGGIYRKLAKKYGISEDNAEYRCKKAKRLRGGPPMRSEAISKPPAEQKPLQPAASWPGPFVDTRDSAD